MPLVPLIVAARNARDLVQLARKALEHYRNLAPDEQERLRGEANRVKALSAELAAAHAKSARERVPGASDQHTGREAKVVANDLREALTQFSHSASQEAAALAKGNSRKMRYAAKAVGFGARRLQRGASPQLPAAGQTDETMGGAPGRDAQTDADEAAGALELQPGHTPHAVPGHTPQALQVGDGEEHAPTASAKAEHTSSQDVSQHFVDSNIDRYSRDESMRVLGVMLREQRIAPDDVLGISRANMSLLLVHRDGVMFGTERGVLKKRVEVGPSYPMSKFATINSEQPGLNDSAITVSDAGGSTVFKANWGTGGQVSRSDAAAERTRIFRIIAAAMDSAEQGMARRPSIASAASKRAGLLDWSAALVSASGVTMTPGLVHEHAQMAAGGIRFLVFLKLGAPRGVDDLAKFFPDGRMLDGDVLETFDALYEQVVQFLGDRQRVDDAIDECLAGAWDEFVRGIREHHG